MKYVIDEYKKLAPFLLYLSCFVSLIFVNEVRQCGVVTFALTCIYGIFLYQSERKAAISFLVAAGIQLLWLLTNRYELYLAGIVLLLVCICFSIIKKNILSETGKKWIYWIKRIIFGISLIPMMFLVITAFTSKPLIKFMQKNMMHAENSFSAPRSGKESVEGGTCISDIEYGTEYPNSFLDIYLTDCKTFDTSPTYIFIHGGGYVWGDKKEGDPNGGDTGEGGLAWYIRQFLEAGYNVVTLNYALAPDYKYPSAVIQLNSALAFLKDYGQEYDLNMDQIIIGGNSGGGQLTGILTSIQTNPVYAKSIGIEAVLEPETIKAAVFSSALIDNDRSWDTGDFGTNYLFLQCGKAYYGWDLLNHNTKITKFMDYMDASFPPSFISDGNTATFYEQAFDLHEKMDSLGIPNEINWYPKDEEVLGHDFETRGTQYSVENIQKILGFLEENGKYE